MSHIEPETAARIRRLFGWRVDVSAQDWQPDGCAVQSYADWQDEQEDKRLRNVSWATLEDAAGDLLGFIQEQQRFPSPGVIRELTQQVLDTLAHVRRVAR